MTAPVTPHDDAIQIAELRARLAEAEDTLRAIRHGEVDALLMVDDGGERVYTLRSADAPYRALVEQMHEGAATLTTEGTIIYANRAFARLVDVPLEQVIGSPIDRFVQAADQDTLHALLLAGAGTLRTGLRNSSPSLLDVHVSVSYAIVDDVEHRTLIVTDVSMLAKAQRESQSKDEFLAMLAHELRNPLAPIRTGLQVLRLAPGEEAAERTREMMDRQISHMVRLIDDLLDVSRVSRGKIDLKKEPIDLKTVINLAVETSLPLIESGRHELKVWIPAEPLPVDADPTRLGQVFSNLLNNAAKYTPDGGRLELAARRVDDEVFVSVTDTGVGIPKERLPDVFEMFSQVGRNLDRAQGGLGIGLTLVRRLTEMHGGSVTAESPGLGGGSTFTVRIPLDRARSAVGVSDLPNDVAPEETAGQRLRVLVVDDNLDGAQALCLLIRMHGHDVAVAHDGPDAVHALRDFRPQLAFVDIGLPGLSGYEVARRTRVYEKGLDVAPAILVALTGWGSDDDKARAQEAGFDVHLTKPVDAHEVEMLLSTMSHRASGGMTASVDPATSVRPGPGLARHVHEEPHMSAIRRVVVALVAAATVALGACGREGPAAPPATSESSASAPSTERLVGPLSPSEAAALAQMTERVKAYVNLHTTIEKALPALPDDATQAQIVEKQRLFETKLREARITAKPGDIFVADAKPVIKRLLATIFGGPEGAQLKASVMDENTVDPVALKLSVNGRYPDTVPLATVPPQVLQTLPELSEDLEYRFIGDWLILLDTHAHVIADYIDNALPK